MIPFLSKMPSSKPQGIFFSDPFSYNPSTINNFCTVYPYLFL
jgi:hypothetical protein